MKIPGQCPPVLVVKAKLGKYKAFGSGEGKKGSGARREV
jgi:hypothetical protein